jgi:hypothetical protein
VTYWRIEEYHAAGQNSRWRTWRDANGTPLEFTSPEECGGAAIAMQKAFPDKRFRIKTAEQRVAAQRRPRKRYIPEALRDQYPE